MDVRYGQLDYPESGWKETRGIPHLMPSDETICPQCLCDRQNGPGKSLQSDFHFRVVSSHMSSRLEADNNTRLS